MEYAVTMRDECGSVQTTSVDASNINEAWDMAESETEDWCRSGEWGRDGASVQCYYNVESESERWIDVEIEPDHDALIKAAGGDTDCDHDWTAEGEGGCDQNPGVWSTGGTSMVFRSHCRKCGLHRIENHTGSQRNPGEHDTVEYTQPDSWCVKCENEECECTGD